MTAVARSGLPGARSDDMQWGPVGGAWHRAVGLSLIWRSPRGPLRFDGALPLDGAERGVGQFMSGSGF